MDDDKITGCFLETSAKRGTFALIDGVMNDLGDKRSDLLVEDLFRAVGGAIVDDDDFRLDLDGGGFDHRDQLGDGGALVVARNDDR